MRRGKYATEIIADSLLILDKPNSGGVDTAEINASLINKRKGSVYTDVVCHISMKTQFHIQLILISVIVLLTTVISLGRDIHSTKVIKLKGYTDTYTISLEYDSAIVSFSLRDVREQLTKLKAKRDYQGRDFQKYFSETSSDISTDKNYLFKSIEDFAAGGGIIEQYVLRGLISKGKATVFDKRTNKYVNRIKKIHYRVSMAGEGHEGYEFAFMNGLIFLVDRISI